MKFIIKPFSEIMIKSKPVRRRTLQMLQNNIHLSVKKLSDNLKVNLFYDKLEVNLIDSTSTEEISIPALKKILSRTPGIESFIEVESHEICDLDAMVEKAAEIYIDQIIDKTFCVRVKRSGKHEFTSTEIERYI
jgi:thiamine biosynthesis protein ThiI